MESNYYKTMKAKENECSNAMRMADIAYEQNGGHCEEECKYLQQAAKLHYDMSQMNVGSQAIYHRRKIQELNTKIKDIMREIDPERYKRIISGEKAKKEEAESKNVKSSSSDSSASTGKKSAINTSTDIDVSTWFKEAPPHSFADVSGMANLKEQLLGCIEDTKLTRIRDYLGIKKLNSYFFIGPPGCGKTYIIEAFAHELMGQEYRYLSLVGSDIMNSYVGVAEKIITRLFDEAIKNEPCIIFIDEIDGVCRNRSDDMPEYMASMTNAFLTGYNKIKNSNKNIIFLGATNYPERVDDAMLDRVEVIRVTLPDAEARKFAFEKAFKDIVSLEEDFTFEEMASDEWTKDYNYRDIDRLTAKIKTMLLEELIDTYGNQDKAISVLQNKEYVLTKELFESAKSQCRLVPKTKIEASLDNWMKKFNNKQNDDVEAEQEEVSNKLPQSVSETANMTGIYQELERLIFNINAVMEGAAKVYQNPNIVQFEENEDDLDEE